MKINKIKQRPNECVATAIAILADLYDVKIDPVKLDDELRAFYKIKEGKGISVFRALSYLKRKKIIKSWIYRKEDEHQWEQSTLYKPFLFVFVTNCTATKRTKGGSYVERTGVITGSHAVIVVSHSANGYGYETLDPQYGFRKLMPESYYNKFYSQSYYINF